ncbi:MAG: hypothetical protein E7F43_04410, partial [Streptococcus sp.]|nr:hypothetical protein [Streptococcus sp.]
MFNSRYKGRQKHKAKIGKLTKKPQFLGNFIFFAKCLGRVRLNTKKLSLNCTPKVRQKKSNFWGVFIMKLTYEDKVQIYEL